MTSKKRTSTSRNPSTRWNAPAPPIITIWMDTEPRPRNTCVWPTTNSIWPSIPPRPTKPIRARWPECPSPKLEAIRHPVSPAFAILHSRAGTRRATRAPAFFHSELPRPPAANPLPPTSPRAHSAAIAYSIWNHHRPVLRRHLRPFRLPHNFPHHIAPRLQFETRYQLQSVPAQLLILVV